MAGRDYPAVASNGLKNLTFLRQNGEKNVGFLNL